jgi:hypothetical protein
LNSVLSELRQWQIGPAELRNSDGRLDSVSVGKLRALADIEVSIRQSIEDANLELGESKLERTMDCATDKPFSQSRILVFSGGHLAPLNVEWLKWCQASGAIVWIVTPFNSQLPYSWTGSQNLAAACNSPIEEVGDLPGLVADFFSLPNKFTSKTEVRIESAADEMAECEWALRRVLADQKSGIRLPNIGIFVRNLRAYAPLLSAAALRLEVPLRLSLNVELLTSQFAIWVVALVRSLVSTTPRSLLEVLASPYSLLNIEDVSGAKGIIYDSMRVRGREWERIHEQIESLPPWIQTAVVWRQNCVEQTCGRKAWNLLLDDFLQIEPVKQMAEQQGTEGKRDQIALEEMRESLARHVFADSTSEVLSLSAFADELEEVWKMASIDIGTHGIGIDVSDSPLELLGKQSIHALGLLEGMFPRRRTEDPILSDWERSILVDTSLPNTLLNSHSISAQESELFLTLLGAAKGKLTLSYPTTNEDRDNVPAFYLAELSDALGETVVKTHHLQGVWTPDSSECLCDADSHLRKAVDSPMQPFEEDIVTNETSLIALRAIPEDRHSIFDLRSASGCAFRFGSHRKLKLNPKVDERRLRRLPKVESLPQFADPESARKELARAWSQYVEEIESESTPEAIGLASAAAKRSINDAVESEFNARELWPKHAGHVMFNAGFESDELNGEIKLSSDDRLRLAGTIPAVSQMGPYRVAQVFHARKALFSSIEKWGDEERLEVGLYFAALGNSSPGAAIEFCADDGERLMVCNEIIPGSQPKSRPKDELKAVSVNARETKFLAQAGEIVRKAVAKSRSHSMEVTPGDQCTFCDFGELCRRSKEFGEQSSLMEENE